MWIPISKFGSCYSNEQLVVSCSALFVHQFSTTYLGMGRRGSSPSKNDQKSLFPGNAKAFKGQPRDIIFFACRGSALGTLPQLNMLLLNFQAPHPISKSKPKPLLLINEI